MLKKFITSLKRLTVKSAKSDSGELLGVSSGFKSVISDLISTRSILPKMVAIFFLLIFIPVFTIGYIAADTASKDLVNTTQDSVIVATQQTSDYFDAFLDKAQSISMQILTNQDIRDYLKIGSIDEAYEKIVLQKSANDAFAGINISSKDLNAKLIFNDGTTLGDIPALLNMDEVLNSDWYKAVQEAGGKAIWIEYDESLGAANKNNYAFSLMRIYKDFVTSNSAGIIIVDVKYAAVSEILAGIKLGKEDATYLLTQGGRALSAQGIKEEEALNKRQFITDARERSANEASGLFHSVDNGVDYLVSFNKSPDTGLTVVTTIPNFVITAAADKIVHTTIVTGIIFILLAVAFSFIFSLRMTLAMKSIMVVMSKAEQGDLTPSLSMKRKDEIGRLVMSFNKMLVKIREMVIQNKQAAEEVVVSSERMASISEESSRVSTEVAHAIVEVASGSSNQASEIEISVKNVSQLADKISLAVKKTKIMEADSESMKELASQGAATIENLNCKTAQTNEITLDVVKEIAQLNQYVQNINVITNVLRSIADQTNLLALNAAIEAARAGEAGKGFAVVAEEIRKLADKSNTHTREIQKHIENIFKQAQSSTNLVGKAEISIREQSEMVTQTAGVFSEINTTTSILAENINKVGGMISDMDSYKENVISSMENISAVSEEVSASTQEVSASTEEQLASIEQLDEMAKKLSSLAGDLLLQMGKFKV